MLIRCWGARGSIPTSGAEYVIYGGDTTCIEIRTREDEIVIIDAGTGIRRLGNLLLAEKRDHFHMIFTHAHWDHILGFPFFKPIYHPGSVIRMFGCPRAQQSIRGMISRTMTAPYFPVNFENLQAEISFEDTCSQNFGVGPLSITPIPLSHPNQGLGYKFVEDGRSFVFLTDNELGFQHPGGLTFEDYVAFSRDTDFLIHDAEFIAEEYSRTRTWGHTVLSDALNLALAARVKKFGLFHHNQDRTDAALDEMVRHCQKTIQDQGANIECFALSQQTAIQL